MTVTGMIVSILIICFIFFGNMIYFLKDLKAQKEADEKFKKYFENLS